MAEQPKTGAWTYGDWIIVAQENVAGGSIQGWLIHEHQMVQHSHDYDTIKDWFVMVAETVENINVQ